MGFFSKLFPKMEERSTSFSMQQWLEMWQKHGSRISVIGTESNTEMSPDDYDTYAEQLYRGNGVVHMVAQARSTIFSEITFKWRPVDEPATPFNLFGTRDLRVLENPWPGGTTGDLLTRAILDVDIAGNFYCTREIGDDGQPRLRRLRPDWVEVVLTAPPDQAVESDVYGYRYYPGGFTSNVPPREYTPEQVAHWAPRPDPHAQYLGMSWLTPVIDDIMLEKHATKHRLSFFKRGAQLGVAVMVKEDLSREQMQEFKADFTSKYTGSKSAYEPLFLGPGADIKVIESDLESLDMKNISGVAETHIAGVAGVPPVVAGLSEGLQGSSLNAGNYKVAAQGFIDRTVRPLWRSFCDAMSPLVGPPTNRRGQPINTARLWYDDRDVAVLNADREQDAKILSMNSATILNMIDKGYTASSAEEYVKTGNIDALEHTGLVSVQLYRPGQNPDDDVEGPTGDVDPSPNVNDEPPTGTNNPVSPKTDD